MDGYVVASEGTEVELGNGVRHIAYLENGEIFVAFTGDRPCAGALLLNSDDQPGWWYAIKRIAPSGPEAFYLVGRDTFDGLQTQQIEAASYLTSGNVLVQTDGAEIPGALWGSVAASYIDERLATV